MELKGIIAISGKPGLFKILSHTKSGVIVESIQDGKRTMASLSSTMSSLDDISMYTETEAVSYTHLSIAYFNSVVTPIAKPIDKAAPTR